MTNFQYCVPEDYSIDGQVVASYDEVEDNDLPSAANNLPMQPFYFAGSLAVGVLMAKVVEAPVLKMRDLLFPSRSGGLAVRS